MLMLSQKAVAAGARRPERLRYAPIGCGEGSFITLSAWIPMLTATGAYEMVGGVPSRDPANLPWFAENFGVPRDMVFNDFSAFLRRLRAEGATDTVLCFGTPTSVHPEQLAAAAEAGITAMLCDKPLVPDWAGMKQVLAAFKGRDPFLGVSFQHIMNAPVFALRQWVQANRDAVAGYHAFFLQGWLATDPGIRQSAWRLAHPWCGLADIGSHSAHMLSFVAGSPLASVTEATLGTGGRHGKQVFDHGTITVTLANSERGTVTFSQIMEGKADDIGIVVRLNRKPWALMWRLEWSAGERLMVATVREPDPDDPAHWTGHLRGMSDLFTPAVNAAFNYSPPGHMLGWRDMWDAFFSGAAGHIFGKRGYPHLKDLPPAFNLPVPGLDDGGEMITRWLEASVRAHTEQTEVTLGSIG